MGVRTTADEKRDSACEHVEAAIKDLSEILIDKCWGHDCYTREYYEGLERAFKRLCKTHQLLDPCR
jgi:hypothetical protein